MRAKPILLALGVAALLGIGVLVYAINRIDTADVFALAAQHVKAQTGRDLKVDGSIGFSVSLEPTITLEDVRFQNAAWGSRPDMLIVKRLDVGIALLPLLSGKVDIRGLRLIEPDVVLETDASGRGNWQFAAPDAKLEAATNDKPLPIDIRHAEVEKGVLVYRSATDKVGKRLELTALEAKTSGAQTSLGASGRLNNETVDISARFDRSASPPNIEATMKTKGATLTMKTALPQQAARNSRSVAHVGIDITDWAAIARLAGTNSIALPALKADGQLTNADDAWTIDALKATLGKSSFAGRVRVDLAKERPNFDVSVDAPLVDLAELQGPAKKEPMRDGRLFSADALPLGALQALDGKLNAHIARLALRDGKAVDGVDLRAVAAQGRIDANPVRLKIDGKELRLRANLDASTGRTLAVDLSVEGSGIALGALGALMNVSGTPEGSPTDLNIRYTSRGESTRSLMAAANADIRIVVGPGRLRNRSIDWGADVTELLNAIIPGRASDSYTELKCAVVRMPIRQGVARIENSIAAQTSKVTVIAAGVIDFRNESIDLGFRPKAATGLGIGLGGLASLGRLRGTFADPKVALDMSGTATAAAQLGMAAATGGLSLLAGGLLSESVPDNACQAALTGAPPRTAATPAQKAPELVDGLVGGIKKLFGR